MTSYGGYNNDYSYTGAGGGGGGGGGGAGWMAGSQQGGAGGSQASPGSSSKDKTHTNTLRPVTIKQLLEAQASLHKDGEWKIDDHDLGHVTFCAQIRSITEQSTTHIYRLDDGTGIIEVRSWVDPEAPTAHESKTKPSENMYVRVLGTLRIVSNNSKRYVAAANAIRPVEFNEVMYHALDATAVHLHFTRGPKEQFLNGGTTTGDVQMGGMGTIARPPSYNSIIKTGGPNASLNTASDNPSWAKLSPSTRRAMQFLSTVDQEGAHLDVIARRTGLSRDEVLLARDELVEASLVFYTVDDDTLAPMNF